MTDPSPVVEGMSDPTFSFTPEPRLKIFNGAVVLDSLLRGFPIKGNFQLFNCLVRIVAYITSREP
jgi:hypothetical protein